MRNLPPASTGEKAGGQREKSHYKVPRRRKRDQFTEPCAISQVGEGDSLRCTGAPAQGTISEPRERGRQFRFPEVQPRGCQAQQLKTVRCAKCAQSLSRVQPFVTPRTAARQAPLSVGVLQARILEWVAMPSSRGSSQPRDWTLVSHIIGEFFTSWGTREAPRIGQEGTINKILDFLSRIGTNPFS